VSGPGLTDADILDRAADIMQDPDIWGRRPWDETAVRLRNAARQLRDPARVEVTRTLPPKGAS
jgi:hypothetical protein